MRTGLQRKILLSSTLQGGNVRPSVPPLHKVPFWIRVYDLPLRGRNNENNAKAIGNKLGEFVSMDKSDSVGINKSLRIRVLIDACKTLPCMVNLKQRGGVVEKLSIKLVKLPVFCYVCDKLGHGEKDCDANTGDDEAERQYSDKLRASPRKINKGEVGKPSKGSCARALFVTRKKPAPTVEEVKVIQEVDEKLQFVSLDLVSGTEKARRDSNEDGLF
ncbi:uncharacterized protein [Spinacia oleracea]|uniref:CCHC-type domain-containing protein n=1 Tax=Spinacia oleracea TaxID=3562 RepID=A0A9R0J4P1_SPIOL|nr:uncharacterized protein LOC110798987 [Spinacia oleracea]